MQRYNLMVLSNPVDGREDEYNDWYSNTHLDDVLRVPGIVGAQRFRLAETQRDEIGYPWRYLAIYACETDDLRQVIDGLRERSGTSAMPISSAMEEDRLVCFFEPIPGAKRGAA
ncbi:DUF4286 family protein [Burkholderia diffusa]|uniref:DUF4286 family protein n=1 Tax=Burkholderia diffusa TaxID=488732 RepID=UPI001588A681|nr:DUF4286 family protein [Burkholderia diffusa]